MAPWYLDRCTCCLAVFFLRPCLAILLKIDMPPWITVLDQVLTSTMLNPLDSSGVVVALGLRLRDIKATFTEAICTVYEVLTHIFPCLIIRR